MTLRRCLGTRLVAAAVLDAPSRAVAESLISAVEDAVMARLEPGRPAEAYRSDSPFLRYFREQLAAFPEVRAAVDGFHHGVAGPFVARRPLRPSP